MNNNFFGKSGSGGFDKALLFSVLAIIAIGLVVLYSASREYHAQNIIVRQAVWIFVGLILLFLVSKLDYQGLVNAAYIIYAINLVFLVLVLFFGETRGGSHRWISLGPFNFQPSELAKITLVLALSSYIGRGRGHVKEIGFFLRSLLFVLPFFVLILLEPDLGSALILIPVALAMLFVAGANIKHIAGTILIGTCSLPFFWHLLKDYQKARLFVFINPNVDPLGSGYTIIQSKIAVGSGGIFGKGWLAGTQNQLNFLPERHTDFIFSVVGEEWGFVGALVLIFLYSLAVYRMVKIIDTTPNLFGKLLATGLMTIFSLQVAINIGMTMGFLPIVGLTLPLISYGGSSLIVTLICIGLILNIGIRRPLF